MEFQDPESPASRALPPVEVLGKTAARRCQSREACLCLEKCLFKCLGLIRRTTTNELHGAAPSC